MASQRQEQALSLRVQTNGIWSDSNHASSNYVSKGDLLALVGEYCDVVGLQPDLAWAQVRRLSRCVHIFAAACVC
jgi:hypothetical protein